MLKLPRRKHIVYAGIAAVSGIALATCVAVVPVRSSLRALQSDAQTLQIIDRAGKPLTITYQNRWNVYDNLPLYAIPDLLQRAFIVSEDKRFFDHGGVDWQARGVALLQNWKSLRTVRGASTITEQVVRMINPRSRTLWSKWVEGIEAALLERVYSKAEIFEFYLNQIPYAANRRGVVQAAHYYFDRDLPTLTPKEMLALVVLARAPSGYDLYKGGDKITAATNRLAGNLLKYSALSADDVAQIKAQTFTLAQPSLPVNAGHFAGYIRDHMQAGGNSIHSTLDSGLQSRVQAIIDDRVRFLSRKNLHNAAVLVADHTTGEILAWVAAGAGDPGVPANQIDAVTVPRQPGSALKPLLYAAALDSGWTPATLIDDAALSGAIGAGLHNFKNYSNIYYGRITLREALANSLNIPALLTINHVGTEKYLNMLHRLGFESLDRGAEIYDEGLALGNGEVTLLELVQGYAALANRGTFRALRFVTEGGDNGAEEQVYSPEAASLIGNILSDGWARRLEFGNNSVLNLPVQTAVKTGTSTDYRDAWAVGFNHRYVVGIWMGNLDHTPTDGVTGSTGPALALRSIFNELGKGDTPQPLWLSPKLVQKDICIDDPHDAGRCYMRSEYFRPGTEPGTQSVMKEKQRFEIIKPTDGLQMAMDPRIPQNHQKLLFTMSGLKPEQTVEWVLNGESITASNDKYLWQMTRGKYRLQAHVKEGDKLIYVVPEISYVVK
ncbi:MAG: transglycosylase domain-containing protein [Pseudomonadota bacterium]